MSSARNAPSPTVVSFGSSSTVDASTFVPTVAPSARSQIGVNRLEYKGKSSERAASMTRSVAHACHPIRLRTGK